MRFLELFAVLFPNRYLRTRICVPAVEDGCIRDTFLRFEVVGECFDGSSVLITLVGRFRHGTSFENIAGFLSNIM